MLAIEKNCNANVKEASILVTAIKIQYTNMIKTSVVAAQHKFFLVGSQNQTSHIMMCNLGLQKDNQRSATP